MSFDSSYDSLTLSTPASYIQSLWRLPSWVASRRSVAGEAEEKFYDASETWESESDGDSLSSCSWRRTLSDYRDTFVKTAQNTGTRAKQSFWDPAPLPETPVSEVQRLRRQYRVIPGDFPDTRHEVIRQEEDLDSLRSRISALESRTVSGILTDTAVSAAKSYLMSRTPLGRFLHPGQPSVAAQQEREGSVQTDRDSTRSWADIVRKQSTLAWETYRTTKQTAIDLATWTYRAVADLSARIWGSVAAHGGSPAVPKPNVGELAASTFCVDDGRLRNRSGVKGWRSRASVCPVTCMREGADTNTRSGVGDT